MRKIKYFFVALAVTALCLSGCKDKNDNLYDGSNQSVKIVFSAIDADNAGNNNTGEYADEIIKRIKDYTGTDFDIIWVPNSTIEDTNSSYISSPKTMPDIVSWGGVVTGDVVSAAKSGLFIDLNQYIWDSNKYPNLSRMSKDVAANLTVDGKLIGIPRARTVGRYGLCYRKDWAEKLGVTLPENATPEDVYNMLYAFTYLDPDGNGIQDTIGMEMTAYTGVFDIIQTWFGCGNGWQIVNGELMPVFITDEYLEALRYIKRLYEDGLMPADYALRPSDSWSNGCKNGQNGVFIDVLDGGKRIWMHFDSEEGKTVSVVNPDENASMVLYGAVNGHTLATAGYNGFFTLSSISLDSEEKIEAALTLLDRLNDEEMLVLTQYGIEYINYEWEDGKIVDLDVNNASIATGYKGLNQLLPYLPSAEATTLPIKADKYADAQTKAYEESLKYAVSNPALSYLVQSDTYAVAGKNLDDEISNLRNKYICGAITEAELIAGIERIKLNGYTDIIFEVNKAYTSR